MAEGAGAAPGDAAPNQAAPGNTGPRLSRRDALLGFGATALILGGAAADVVLDRSRHGRRPTTPKSATGPHGGGGGSGGQSGGDTTTTGGTSSSTSALAVCETGGSAAGPLYDGRFFSKYRNTVVNYRLAYPPGHDKGDSLPLVVYLHAYLGNYESSFGGLRLDAALAQRPGGAALAPMAMICPDGGNLYWHAHPGDDPMSMLLYEIIPMCQHLGLGRGTDGNSIVATGISMGGFGALDLTELHPTLVSAVAVISPAVWTTYADALLATQTAFTSQADFDANDVTAHAGALAGKPVRIASGTEDPFHPYVEVLAEALPKGAVVVFPPGAHDDTFFDSEGAATLAFLSEALRSSAHCKGTATA